jgi:hypothetical protein
MSTCYKPCAITDIARNTYIHWVIFEQLMQVLGNNSGYAVSLNCGICSLAEKYILPYQEYF